MRTAQACAACGVRLARCVGIPVAVADPAAKVDAHQPPDAVAAADAARRVAVADAAKVDAHQPPDVVAAADAARRVAVADTARVGAHQPPDVFAAADVARRVAVADTARVGAHQPPDVSAAADAGIHQPDVADHRAAGSEAKQAHIVSRWPIDGQVANAVAQAVKRTGKSIG